jgi:hypothetical protein
MLDRTSVEAVVVEAAQTLRTEIEFFESQKELLLENHEGQFALVSGQQILGTFTTEAEAYQAGLDHIGNKPFLIRQILRQEPPLQAPVLFVGVNLGSSA